MLNVIIIRDMQVDCPKENRKVKLSDCISCRRLKMIQPRENGEVWCCKEVDTPPTEAKNVKAEKNPPLI